MKNVNEKAFYKLINLHRKSKASNHALNVNGELIYDSHEQCQAWSKYFAQLATPLVEPQYDSAYLEQAEMEVAIIDHFARSAEPSDPFTVAEVCEAIGKLNTGKAADEDGLCAEGLKLVSQEAAPVLCTLFNHMRKLGCIPPTLKRGILTPVSKKDKSRLYQDNYRGITVTATLGKVLEHMIKKRIEPHQNLHQSTQQVGFTEGVSPAMAALMVTEAIAEAEDTGSPLFLCTLDAKKAFDTVCHTSLLRKLWLEGIDLRT
jgi:hypothetical protein